MIKTYCKIETMEVKQHLLEYSGFRELEKSPYINDFFLIVELRFWFASLTLTATFLNQKMPIFYAGYICFAHKFLSLVTYNEMNLLNGSNATQEPT